MSDVEQAKINNITYDIKDPTKVSKSGDTMSGTLRITQNNEAKFQAKNTDVTEGIAPVSTKWIGTLGFLDNNDNVMGYVGNNYNPSKSSVTRLLARQRISGTTYDNSLDLAVLSDGSSYVGIPDSAKSAWLDALGLGDSGWQSLTDNTKFSGTIYYRKIGKMVEVVAYQLTLASALSSDSVVLAQLPSGYRPSYNVSQSAQITNTYSASVMIYMNGDILLSKNIHDTSVSTTQNIYFNSTFFVS